MEESLTEFETKSRDMYKFGFTNVSIKKRNMPDKTSTLHTTQYGRSCHDARWDPL